MAESVALKEVKTEALHVRGLPANAEVTPGRFLETMDDGETRKYQHVSSAAAHPDRAILALEDWIEGMGEVIPAGDEVRGAYLASGDQVLAEVRGYDMDAGTSAAVSKEDELVKTDDGRLALDSTSDPTAKALEAVSSGDSVLILVEVL